MVVNTTTNVVYARLPRGIYKKLCKAEVKMFRYHGD